MGRWASEKQSTLPRYTSPTTEEKKPSLVQRVKGGLSAMGEVGVPTGLAAEARGIASGLLQTGVRLSPGNIFPFYRKDLPQIIETVKKVGVPPTATAGEQVYGKIGEVIGESIPMMLGATAGEAIGAKLLTSKAASQALGWVAAGQIIHKGDSELNRAELAALDLASFGIFKGAEAFLGPVISKVSDGAKKVIKSLITGKGKVSLQETEKAAQEVKAVVKIEPPAKGVPEVAPPVQETQPKLFTPLEKPKQLEPPIPEELGKKVLNRRVLQDTIQEATEKAVQDPNNAINTALSMRLFRRIGDELKIGNIMPEQVQTVLKKYSLSPEQFAREFVETISESGRSLAMLSKMAKEIQANLPKTPEIAAQFAKLDQRVAEMGLGARIFKKFVDGYISLDNVRRGLLVTQTATAVRNAISQTGRMGLETFVDALTGTARLATGKESSFRLAYADAVQDIAAIGRAFTKKGRERVSGILEKFADESMLLLKTPAIGEVTTPQRFVKTLNFLNNFQEMNIRKMAFDAHISTAMVRAGVEQPTEKMVQEAVKHSLDITFARSDFGLAKSALRLYKDAPFLTLLHAFPRFWANAMKFMWDYNPTGFLKLMDKKFVERFVSGERETYKELAKATTGTMMLGAGIAMRNGEYAGEKWYELKLPNGKTIDTRAFAPFSTYLFLGEMISRPNTMKPSDAIEGGLSISRVAGTASLILGLTVGKDWDGAIKGIERMTGEFIGGFVTPFQTIKDFIGNYEEAERTYRDVREAPITGPLRTRIPFVSQTLPESMSITRGTPIEREQPALRQMTGLTMTTKTFLETELDRMGIERYTLSPRTGIPELDRLIAEDAGKRIFQWGETLKENPTYQTLPNDKKQDKIKEKISQFKSDAKERVLGRRPDLKKQLREK